MQGRDVRRVLLLLGLVAFVCNPILASAAPVTLPSGKVVELTAEQVATIKGQPGVFFSSGAPEVPAKQAVVGLPQELGGGFVYGTPESLAQAFATAGAAVGPPAEAFALAPGLSTAAKVGIGVGAAAALGIAAAALAGGGGGGTTTTAHH
jgi:hypothetical protein